MFAKEACGVGQSAPEAFSLKHTFYWSCSPVVVVTVATLRALPALGTTASVLMIALSVTVGEPYLIKDLYVTLIDVEPSIFSLHFVTGVTIAERFFTSVLSCVLFTVFNLYSS